MSAESRRQKSELCLRRHNSLTACNFLVALSQPLWHSLGLLIIGRARSTTGCICLVIGRIYSSLTRVSQHAITRSAETTSYGRHLCRPLLLGALRSLHGLGSDALQALKQVELRQRLRLRRILVVFGTILALPRYDPL